MNQPKRQLPALTSLRVFLAVWVIVYHQIPDSPDLTITWLPGAPLGVYSILRTGYIAVTIFFVLSGFVLSYNYDLSEKWSQRTVLRFGVARFSRIYPAYIIGLLVLVPFFIYRVINGVGAPVTFELWTGTLNVLLVQAWFPRAALTWNFPGWSLSDEAFFYTCMPIIGVLLWRIRRAWWILAAIGVCWGLSLLCPLIAVLMPILGFGDASATTTTLISPGIGANLIRYYPAIRIPEFCAGILVARLFRVLPEGSALFGRGYWFYLPGIFLSLLILSVAEYIPYPLVHNGLLLPLYAATVFGFALDGGLLARLLSSKPLVFLGNASYSMYIMHVPIAICLSVVGRRWLGMQPQGLWWVILYTVTVVVISSLFFKLVEEPLHRTTRKKLDRWLQSRAAAQPVPAR